MGLLLGINPAWIAVAVSAVGSPLALLFLGGIFKKLSRIEKVPEKQDALEAKFDLMSAKFDSHMSADEATFTDHSSRLTRIEATLETLLTLLKSVITVEPKP